MKVLVDCETRDVNMILIRHLGKDLAFMANIGMSEDDVSEVKINALRIYIDDLEDIHMIQQCFEQARIKLKNLMRGEMMP